VDRDQPLLVATVQPVTIEVLEPIRAGNGGQRDGG